MSNDYSEDKLVQESTAEFMEKELGWRSVYAFDNEGLGEKSLLGRRDYKEVLLVRHFKKALKVLNPWINDVQMSEATERMTEYMSSQSLMQINEQKYAYIRDGIPVKRHKPNGETEEVRAKIIDFDNADRNEFICVRELKVYSPEYNYSKRADVVGFVNGIPLLFMELKNYNVEVSDAYHRNYKDYLDTIPQLFYYNSFIILSNGASAKIGTINSKWEFFHEWKRIAETDKGDVALPTMLKGVCQKENFLDLLENFILYDHSGGNTAKILARNHQFLGVNNVIGMYDNRETMSGKLGVFWHTQGSGKSYSMLFLSQKIRRKFQGSPTILVLTDRDELNKQISDTFESCGLLGAQKAEQFIAQSGADLKEKLKKNHSFIFSLIQKFNDSKAKPIYPDHDIIIMSDEAHRTQNGIFADNMMQMLPTANRIGFTGTPLLSHDNITKRTFGEYISIYDFQRAVEDGATVPLYYENRGAKLPDIENPEINEEIIERLDQEELNASEQAKLEQEFAKEVHLLTAEKRLRTVAKDFARHYSDIWTTGKAMFICYNKVTCVRMYNYVQECWKQEIEDLKTTIKKSKSSQEVQELKRKLKWMEETEMAVVVSTEQNEIQTFESWGLDIVPHRNKMTRRELDKEFKDPDNPFRVVFVCAMWLTGFDVKTLSALYIDKPMKAHNLMQAIARANRVAEGKSNGLIIDYIGLLKALRKALADYTAAEGDGGRTNPLIDKEELINKVWETINETIGFLNEHGVDLQNIIDKTGFNKLSELMAAEAMCATAEIRKTFCALASRLLRLWKYLDREEITPDMKKKKEAIEAIWKGLQKKRRHADITKLSADINAIINSHINKEGLVSEYESPYSKAFDISNIDFDTLKKEFADRQIKHLIVSDIQDLLKEAIEKMLAVNPSRINFYERYLEIIREYNNEQNRATIEKTFEDLLNLSRSLTEEQQRYVKEGFENDEQLAVYELLLKDDLSKKDIVDIKKVAVELLDTVSRLLKDMQDPFDKQETKAILRNKIRNILYINLPDTYTEDSISLYRDKVFDYIHQQYVRRFSA